MMIQEWVVCEMISIYRQGETKGLGL